jgi:hypothetical protein
MHTLQHLMQKEMTRKEFLVTLGFGIATAVGLSSLLRMLGKNNPFGGRSLGGYGSSSYGGKKAV